jgi:sulfoxide reductase heme-binding subunit YedZ
LSPRFFPWLDRAGRLSPPKLAVFLLVLAPGMWLAVRWSLELLGPKPVTQAIHETGDWAVRLLLATLLVTPLRRIGSWPKLFLIRRMLGVAALAYALIHLSLYMLDQAFDLARIAAEIALRIYLAIGFAALLGLAVLGATSTDRSIRRLGPRWHQLHGLVYGIGALALAHYFLQSKLDVIQPVLWTGFFLVLMGTRAVHKLGLPQGPLGLVALALACGLATALLEAGWYAAATGARAALVLEANLDFAYEIRPAWWVLAAGLALAALRLARPSAEKSAQRRRATPSRPAAAEA